MYRKRKPPVGSRPGTLVIPEDSPKPRMFVIDFVGDEIEEREVTEVEQLAAYRNPETVTWIDVQGLGDETVLRAVAETFSLHPLVIEDIVHVPQRPKVEIYDDYQVVLGRMLTLTDPTRFEVEQVSIVFGQGWVITFQERPGDVFEPVRWRIRSGQGAIRRLGADYLAYALLDTIIDAYFSILETLGDHLEDLEDDVMVDPSEEMLQRLNDTKAALLTVRRTVWPQRDALNSLVRGDAPGVSAEVRVYLRDTYDHCIQQADVVEAYRELVAGLLNTYLTVVSNRMNEIMKVLTVMASIFIPLTFLAGIYGMNFDVMPELHIEWFYFTLWGFMVLVATGLTLFFYRKGWLGDRERRKALRRST